MSSCDACVNVSLGSSSILTVFKADKAIFKKVRQNILKNSEVFLEFEYLQMRCFGFAREVILSISGDLWCLNLKIIVLVPKV